MHRVMSATSGPSDRFIEERVPVTLESILADAFLDAQILLRWSFSLSILFRGTEYNI